MTVPAWLEPTLRSIRWVPVAAACVGATAVLVCVRVVSPVAPDARLIAVIVGAVVASAVAALADPADELLRALPTPAGRRLARRIVLVGVPALAGVTVLVRAGAALYGVGWAAPGAAAIIALAACGVAAGAVAGRGGAARAELAAIALIGWVAIGFVAAQTGVDASWTAPWWRWPLPMTLTSLAVTAVVVRRR